MLRARRRRRRRASGEKLAAVMPAKFDAILADDDSARKRAYRFSRKQSRSGNRMALSHPTRKQLLRAVDYGDWCESTCRTESSCGQPPFRAPALLQAEPPPRYDAFTSEATKTGEQ